ncbi:DUF4359 domain-containing protein [Alkalinema sp. FACHB-956]|uniref:DUF4359 domain-containing protein n=1 Tax=Alkalinema sp. FACHB-956 TaxID=2692768 RepID=UPI001685B504|nr:DUF4359 domain-containing protein [Alkalinema sp. FACHB-956]MBD2329886.1 DUF4359 domain-containing protein [Alkalinema sp. FACHB-956]
MKAGQWITGVSVLVGLGIGALMVATNPEPSSFEAFAIDQMKSELCPQVPLGLAKQCPRLVEENQEQVKAFIRGNTQRQNYWFFSAYQTQLSLRSVVPNEMSPLLSALPIPTGYDLETIGVLGQFYVYRTESKRF